MKCPEQLALTTVDRKNLQKVVVQKARAGKRGQFAVRDAYTSEFSGVANAYFRPIAWQMCVVG
jgi:hypothetical protein